MFAKIIGTDMMQNKIIDRSFCEDLFALEPKEINEYSCHNRSIQNERSGTRSS